MKDAKRLLSVSANRMSSPLERISEDGDEDEDPVLSNPDQLSGSNS